MLTEKKDSAVNQAHGFGLGRLHTLAELQEAGRRYPYSLPVQASLARWLKQADDMDYDRFVKKSAILSPDRQWLYRFMESAVPARLPEPVQEKQIPVLQPVAEPPVVEPAVPEPEPLVVPPVAQPVAVAEIPQPPVQPVVTPVPVQETVQPVEIPPVEAFHEPGPLHFDLDEVELPGHDQPLADDGSLVIEQVLQQVDFTEEESLAADIVAEETMITVEKQPVVEVRPEPVQELPPSVPPVINDMLEREILKEAIDKTIQKEVSQLQPDILAETPTEPEPAEKEERKDDFQYWLNPSRKKTETREQKLKKIDALIEKFIKSEPRIVPKKAEFFSPTSVAKQSVAVDEDLVSEPLAQIFEKQGYFDKAIKAYEKLSLKIPEKRAYFATRIEKIKEIIRNIKNNKE